MFLYVLIIKKNITMIEHFLHFFSYKFMFKLYILIVEIWINLKNKINYWTKNSGHNRDIEFFLIRFLFI
jgi:hypothetical protein